jgi:hypothetical protein
MHSLYHYPILSIAIALALSMSPNAPIPKPQLTLYDPQSNKYIYTNWNVGSFSLSKDNRLAYEKDGNIYIWDYPFTENTSAEIIMGGSPTTEKRLLTWSLDGRYFLLTGVQAGNKKLFLWDGKNFLEIYNPQKEVYFYHATWSNNGKLAFTEYLTQLGDVSKDFVWDGKDVISLSPNPSMFPAWSKDGQLAFLSRQSGEYNIFVWDGKSKNNGVPDIKALAAPDLEFSDLSQPTWTNSGSIVFTGHGKTDLHTQVYEWDGQTAKNISQTPSFNIEELAWRNDGYWSATSYITMDIHDNDNRIILETKGNAPRWTQSGLLVFCKPNGKDWTLSIWNGKNIIDIAHGEYIEAKWTNSNGKSIVCTYG